jgi:tetratricopeptide (TPR) repeat protein
LFEPRVLVSMLVILAFLAIAIKLREKRPLFSFAVLWVFISLIPVSNIFYPLTNYIAARYLYLPVAGFCLLLAVFLFRLANVRVVSMILLIFYSIFTAIGNTNWKNNIVFWSGMVKNYPNNALAHSNLGASFRKGGLLDKAIYEYKIAIALDSNYAKDYNALGVCYYQKGVLDNAISEFKKALKLDPNLIEAYISLGAVMGDKGLYKEAIVNFERALKIDSGSVQAYDGLVVTYARMKKFDKAKTLWEKALEINPEYKNTQDNLKKLRGLGY